MNTIYFEGKHQQVQIRLKEDLVTMSQIIEELVIPALLAMGFHPETVDSYFPQEELSYGPDDETSNS